MTVAPMVEPDRNEMRRHLGILFAPAQIYYPEGLIELRYGAPGELLNHWRYFPVSDVGLDAAAAFASDQNRRGDNVYVGVNPRKPSTEPSNAGNTDDVEIAFFQFADIDHPDAANAAISRTKNLPPSLVIMTGTEPAKR